MLNIAGRTILRHASNQPSAAALARLEAGAHPFSFVFYKAIGSQPPGGALHVEGPDMPRSALKASPRRRQQPAPISIVPTAEPTILRSFIFHKDTKRTHAVSVGDPSGAHYSLDLQRGALRPCLARPFR